MPKVIVYKPAKCPSQSGLCQSEAKGETFERLGVDDMKTYYNLFGVNRVPGEPKDSLMFNPNSKHIIIAHNKNVRAN